VAGGSVPDSEQLSAVIDEVQEAVWSKLSRKARPRRRKHEFALVDLDGHIKPLYGVQKEGADFSYDGRWSYQPLVVWLGGSGECLKVVNQPGSGRPSDAAAGALQEVLPRVRRAIFETPWCVGIPTLTAVIFSTPSSMRERTLLCRRLLGRPASGAGRFTSREWSPTGGAIAAGRVLELAALPRCKPG
jgi:hypothetical protein